MKTTDEQVRLAVRAILAVRNELQRELARSIGLTVQTLNGRLNGVTRWTLADLDALADHWGCQPWDLMQGPAEAIRRISGDERRNGVPA